MIYARRLLERIVRFANDDSIEDPEEVAVQKKRDEAALAVARRQGLAPRESPAANILPGTRVRRDVFAE